MNFGRICIQVFPNPGPADDESDVINEQHAIYNVKDDVKISGKVGQAKLG